MGKSMAHGHIQQKFLGDRCRKDEAEQQKGEGFPLSQSQARAIGVTVELLGKALDHKEFLKLLGSCPAEKPQEGFSSKGGLHT